MRTNRKEIKAVIEQEPALDRVRVLAGDTSCYLVGGTVRDALLGRPALDLDLAVDGPVADLALRLDTDAVLHERFDTAEIEVDGRRIDLARTRSERYARPGALPVVEPARIEQDLTRRDFTINALAAPLAEPGEVIDPCGGIADLERRAINVIQSNSFVDDPTRALRAARYAARLGFDLDHRAADLLPTVNLGSVSRERLEGELDLIAREPTALEALRLATAWGLLTLPEAGFALLADAFELLEKDTWADTTSRTAVLLEIAGRSTKSTTDNQLQYPGAPSLACSVAASMDPVALVLARAAGSEWLDQWIQEWRQVSPEVSGNDLLAEGIPGGASIGVGLDAALVAALDQGVSDREEQLAIAVAAARTAQLREAP
ncbi:MAG: hypothetical protein WD181_01420 [Solirubrobacterales bacterium]